MLKPKVLFQLSGSIACYKACDLISKLTQEGFEVKVVCSASALKFVGQAALEGLTGSPVISDSFAAGHAMDHINLTRWADWAILCPASANKINQLATGSGNDIINDLFLAWPKDKPYFVVPAMNSNMYSHFTTQKSLQTLKDQGYSVLPVGTGQLACGEEGPGRMLSTEEILNTIQPNKFHQGPKKILITSGGTREFIDGVRFIGNTSTGITGKALANCFIEEGHDVTFLFAEKSQQPEAQCKKENFTDFSSLNSRLMKLLSQNYYDHIFHLAAVSDYSVDSLAIDGSELNSDRSIKLSSTNESLEIKLKKNFKIINKIKDYSKNKNINVVAFKLTNSTDKDVHISAINQLFNNDNVNYVVHNDLHLMSEESHVYSIYSKNGFIKTMNGAHELAQSLEKIVKQSVQTETTPSPEVFQ